MECHCSEHVTRPSRHSREQRLVATAASIVARSGHVLLYFEKRTILSGFDLKLEHEKTSMSIY